MTPLPQALLAIVQHGLLNKYFIIAADAILVYDYLLMLPAEIEHIWMSKWGVGNLLYILTRYTAFVESPFLILYAFNVGYGHSSNAKMLCERAYKVAGWLDLWGIVVANNILYLRTAAIWGWTRRALACVALANMIVVPLTIWSLSASLRSMKFIPSPIPSIFPCNAEFLTNTAYIDFATVIANETCVFALTVCRRFRSWPEHPTPLLRTLYYDAVLFFGCLCFVSTMNLILYTDPRLKDFYQLLVEMQYVLHSVSTARIILHLRITGSKPGTNDGSVLLSNEYMKHKTAFQSVESSRYIGTDSEILSIELHPRGPFRNTTMLRDEAKAYTVVNPYMI